MIDKLCPIRFCVPKLEFHRMGYRDAVLDDSCDDNVAANDGVPGRI